MRIRATVVAAVSGALALSALAAPAAQADGPSFREKAASAFASAHGASARSTFSTAAVIDDLDVSFSNFKIATAVKVGTTNKVSTTVTYKITHGADVDIKSEDFDTGPYLYKGSFEAPVNLLFGDYAANCTATSSTTANCTGKIDIYPAYGELINSDAGTWKGGALALNYETEQYADKGALGTIKVQRYSKLTVNASPEPVKKGKTITVTGKLTRANWETNKYAGYTNQSVKLQFRKKNSSTYTTVKTIKTNSTGNLKTTVKASVDGYYRYNFEGTTTTPAVKAAGDFVDVK
ncbi:hypothetical protein DIZ27_17435 [Streptomyces sp. NWU339]|uniref:hypothetical protein n=1 Tax=Streptomyces sp. NWU339 TaxID=2185284 RepID=UPI000D684C0A|nr:hypothetical protein [Streptomyces sp. NWU339]PWI09462.1 hypothetical protein DIZ27_17435 [Streptomyces sp. NWU339]